MAYSVLAQSGLSERSLIVCGGIELSGGKFADAYKEIIGGNGTESCCSAWHT